MDNRKHVDGCSLSSIPYEFASCGCLHAQAEADALRAEVEAWRITRERHPWLYVKGKVDG